MFLRCNLHPQLSLQHRVHKPRDPLKPHLTSPKLSLVKIFSESHISGYTSGSTTLKERNSSAGHLAPAQFWITQVAAEKQFDQLFAQRLSTSTSIHLLFLKVVLESAPKHRMAELRKRRLYPFFDKDLDFLMAEARKIKPPFQATRNQTSRRRNEQGADAAAMSALYAWMPGRALRRLGQGGSLPADNETLAALQALHPQDDDPISCPLLVNAPPVAANIVARSIILMRQSAAGPSGLRADHLLLAYPAGVSNTLLSVINSICNGKAPAWLADAKLLAIPKKSGGVRPIAIGETLRRLASSAILRSSIASLPPLCRQFILKRDGCITVASLTSAAVNSNIDNCVLTIDLRNAFNCVNRTAILSAVSGSPISRYA